MPNIDLDFDRILKYEISDRYKKGSCLILRDGRFINLYPDWHLKFFDRIKTSGESFPGLDDAIKINDGNTPGDEIPPYIEVKEKPTSDQYYSLALWLDHISGEINLIVWQGYRQQDTWYYLGSDDVDSDYIISRIKRFYASGSLYEGNMRHERTYHYAKRHLNEYIQKYGFHSGVFELAHRYHLNKDEVNDILDYCKTIGEDRYGVELHRDKILDELGLNENMNKLSLDESLFKPMNEGLKIIMSMSNFSPWGDAQTNYNRLIAEDKLDDFVAALEERYPHGITMEELNSLLARDNQYFKQIGFDPKPATTSAAKGKALKEDIDYLKVGTGRLDPNWYEVISDLGYDSAVEYQDGKITGDSRTLRQLADELESNGYDYVKVMFESRSATQTSLKEGAVKNIHTEAEELVEKIRNEIKSAGDYIERQKINNEPRSEYSEEIEELDRLNSLLKMYNDAKDVSKLNEFIAEAKKHF